ncbi:MAG: hypothetical protein Tp125SUR00d2C35697761_13 [Prokaryotic dsDNA virus sp.]|nr:MAG: hypothetical protein Tp125SUR00d2C35697761_13 [Prokaryotic dsDNA virus sp.]QDP66058.1 MAG: hypothetical protein Unbinned4336contig1000_23 [Prokaryotic dsDNA virus sp.]
MKKYLVFNAALDILDFCETQAEADERAKTLAARHNITIYVSTITNRWQVGTYRTPM